MGGSRGWGWPLRVGGADGVDEVTDGVLGVESGNQLPVHEEGEGETATGEKQGRSF